MVNHDTQKYGKAAALARATQGGHTNNYAQVVLQILPKEDVSRIIQSSTTLDGHSYFEKLGSILAQQKSELHSVCKKFSCLNPIITINQKEITDQKEILQLRNEIDNLKREYNPQQTALNKEIHDL